MARLLPKKGKVMEDLVKIEDISSIKKKILIQVGSESVDKKFDDFFNSIKKEAQIPGFRKGRAPTNILKKYLKDKASGAVSQMLVSEHYQNAIKNHNINPVGNPVILNDQEEAEGSKNNVGVFKDDGSYEVEITVETMPEVEPVGYDDITINLPDYNFDDLFERRMLEHRNSFAEREQVMGRGAEDGDSVIIDFKGFVDGEQFEGGTSENFAIDSLCSGTLIPGFEDQIVGMKASESKRIKVSFPDDYGPKHLEGKEAEFDITLHSIVRKKLADIDDDLAMMVGFETADELKENVKKEVVDEIEKNKKQILEYTITNQILEKNDFDIPEILVLQEEAKILQQSNIKNPSEQVIGEIKKNARDNIRKIILFEAIFEKEKLEISPSELNDHLEEQAKIYGRSKDELVSMLHNTKSMDAFVGVLRVQKVVDFLSNLNTKKDEEENE